MDESRQQCMNESIDLKKNCCVVLDDVMCCNEIRKKQRNFILFLVESCGPRQQCIEESFDKKKNFNCCL